MELKMINENDIQINRILEMGFSRREYKEFLSEFLEEANKGVSLEVPAMIGYLIGGACSYCGTSVTFRTAYYDFAWALLDKEKSLWTEEEIKDGFSLLHLHFDLYPEYNDEFEEYDVGTLDYGEYFWAGMNLFIKESVNKSIIAYSMYIFFDYWKFQYNDGIVLEAKMSLDDCIEEEE